MAVRPRLVLIGLALALVVYLGLTAWYQHRRAALIGLTERPCTVEGRSATGSDMDDWAALCAWRAENRRLLASGRRPEMVMIGDSLTERWPGLDDGIITRGVGGQTSAQVLLRFRQDAIALRPRIVHILVGANDLLGLGGPVSADQFAGNVLDMVELAQLHGAAVIVGTVPPMRDFAGYKPGDPAPDIARLNARLSRLAASRGLVLADYHAALIGPDARRGQALFTDDGIHLSREGYAAMKPVLDAALAEARRVQKPAQAR